MVRDEDEEEEKREFGPLIRVFLDQRGGGRGGEEHILDKEEEWRRKGRRREEEEKEWRLGEGEDERVGGGRGRVEEKVKRVISK